MDILLALILVAAAAVIHFITIVRPRSEPFWRAVAVLSLGICTYYFFYWLPRTDALSVAEWTGEAEFGWATAFALGFAVSELTQLTKASVNERANDSGNLGGA